MCISFPTEMYFHAVSPGPNTLGLGKVTKKKRMTVLLSLSFPSVKNSG